jgi:hypothetical protein
MLDLLSRFLHGHTCNGDVLLPFGQEFDFLRDFDLLATQQNQKELLPTFDQEQRCDKPGDDGGNALDDENL